MTLQTVQMNGPAPPFHVMAKAIGPVCNLRCRYCFYLEKERLYPGETQWTMPDHVLESYIRQTTEARDGPAVAFAWQGGEPTLLGVDFFTRVVELQTKYAGGKRVENALQTNGVLLDDAWCAFLAKHRFLVGISLDGPRELHERLRVNRGGGGSFDQVMRGLALLRKHGVEFNTLTVVHRENSRHPLEVYRFLKEAGSRFQQFIPLVERVLPGDAPDAPAALHHGKEREAAVADWSVEPVGYGTFLCTIFDEWVRRDVGKVFVQLFDVALERWSGLAPSLCIFRETCGEDPVLEHNGDLYACDHYVYPEHLRGNITEHPLAALARSPEQLAFGRMKRDGLPEFCRQCSSRFICNGECPKHRFARTLDGETGLNYLCAAYKMFFEHIDPAMRFMAEELRVRRPPANVMTWMREHDAGRCGRNDPCFCGSGRKYKHCHGV